MAVGEIGASLCSVNVVVVHSQFTGAARQTGKAIKTSDATTRYTVVHSQLGHLTRYASGLRVKKGLSTRRSHRIGLCVHTRYKSSGIHVHKHTQCIFPGTIGPSSRHMISYTHTQTIQLVIFFFFFFSICVRREKAPKWTLFLSLLALRENTSMSMGR